MSVGAALTHEEIEHGLARLRRAIAAGDHDEARACERRVWHAALCAIRHGIMDHGEARALAASALETTTLAFPRWVETTVRT